MLVLLAAAKAGNITRRSIFQTYLRMVLNPTDSFPSNTLTCVDGTLRF
jgi:hypothetical protein